VAGCRSIKELLNVRKPYARILEVLFRDLLLAVNYYPIYISSPFRVPHPISTARFQIRFRPIRLVNSFISRISADTYTRPPVFKRNGVLFCRTNEGSSGALSYFFPTLTENITRAELVILFRHLDYYYERLQSPNRANVILSPW